MKPDEFRIDRIEPERGVRLVKLLNEVLELTGSELSTYVERACSGDPELKAQLEALIAADRQAGDFLERPAPEQMPEALERLASSLRESNLSGTDVLGRLTTRSTSAEGEPVQSIGPYRILELLGEGGMGSVYLAEQHKPVHRKVAVKVIRRGMDTKRVVARFEAERQALALMDHSNIAKVFDAGVTPSDRPYFVMEYVKGVPITTYCDKQKLTMRERLELFMRLCDGVQHAHQKAIIHRDLKPSNVLVTVQDDKPMPKIIDFGVAKATAQRLTEETVYTALGELIGTPEYMSPEQAEMTGENVDTRTDVYSLGVILYELLAGVLPFEPTELRKAGFAGIVSMIREQDPPRPSTRVSTLGERTTDIASARRTAPRKLSNQLQGDLDWITMRALEKDRSRRYTSAAELAADVRRHLRHEPVSAGPPGSIYRLKKFVRRHRIGVMAGSIVAISLVTAVIVSVRFVLSEAQQRRAAATERDVSQAVNDFLNNDILSAVAPSLKKGQGKDVLMRDVLHEAARRIDEAAAMGGKFGDKPLVEASIRQTLGLTYITLGQHREAQPHLERALELRSRELGEDHPETFDTLIDLGRLYVKQGLWSTAEPLLLRSLEIGTRIWGEEHRRVVAVRGNLAIVYKCQGRYDAAEHLSLKNLDISTRFLGKDDRFTVKTMHGLANLYSRQGRFAEAEQLYVKTLELKNRVHGEGHPEVALAMESLGQHYLGQGLFDEAEPLLLKSFEIRKTVLGEEHPETLRSMGGLAKLYDQQGRYDEAEPLFLRSVAIQKRALGDEHLDVLINMSNLATMYFHQGRYDEAEPLHLKALEINTRTLGEEHPYTLAFMHRLASVYMMQGHYDAAEPLSLKACEARKRVQGEEHRETLESMCNVARLYARQGRYDEAESLYVKTLEIQKRVLGEEHRDTANLMMNLGSLYHKQSRFEEAHATQAQALIIARRAWPAGGRLIGHLLGNHGATLTELGRYEDAEAALVEAQETLASVVGLNHEWTIEVIESRAKLYDAWAKPEMAAEWRGKLPTW